VIATVVDICGRTIVRFADSRLVAKFFDSVISAAPASSRGLAAFQAISNSYIVQFACAANCRRPFITENRYISAAEIPASPGQGLPFPSALTASGGVAHQVNMFMLTGRRPAAGAAPLEAAPILVSSR
jgi:hypothetical protein